MVKSAATVRVGSGLVSLDGEANGGSSLGKSPEPQRSSPPQTPQSVPQGRPVGGPIIAPPSTRKLARELNVNLEMVKGSGPGGRITDDDVRAYSAGSKQQLVPQI